MLNRIKMWWFALVATLILEMLIVVFSYYYLNPQIIIIITIVLLFDALLVGFLLLKIKYYFTTRVSEVTQFVANNNQEGLALTKSGLITFSEEYEVLWVSELFSEYQEDLITQKITILFPELQELFFADIDEVEIIYHDRTYKVSRSSEGRSVFWQDISEIENLKQKLQGNQYVLGFIHMDNYNELIQGIDDSTIANINSNIRQAVVNWAVNNKIVIRRIRDDRFILFLNEETYLNLERTHFTILEEVRDEAEKLNIPITLSMAFARGSNDLPVLEEMLRELSELAQTRGGDQVVVKVYQEEVKYFGGSSEAYEKRNRVKARVMTRALGELVETSSKVFVVGHDNMDFDCVGAMFGVASIAQNHHEEVFVIIEDINKDSQLEAALSKHKDSIADKYNLINEETALFEMDDDSLVICVDHHNYHMCSAKKLIEKSERVVVIDHHRRGEEFLKNTIMIYIEPSASSTCELLAEMIDYQSEKIELDVFVSTLMLAGVIVDTNHFRVRSGTRTFMAASLIKGFGADVNEADSFLKEDFSEFEVKTRFYQRMEKYSNDIVIACGDEETIYSRSMISKISDSLLRISQVEAAFTIAKVEKNGWAISARSDGIINVQRIMEEMGGGGHFSAAALQKEDTTVAELKASLIEVLSIEDKVKK
ncbi:MAG: DHH family phosphoesterase [Erysipelotrichaceae bacterium]